MQRTFAEVKSESDFESNDFAFCFGCQEKLVRLKAIEDEAEIIKHNLLKLFQQSKSTSATVNLKSGED